MYCTISRKSIVYSRVYIYLFCTVQYIVYYRVYTFYPYINFVLHNALCTLGCTHFIHIFILYWLHKILIREAFYSPRQGDYETVFIFFLIRIFLEYSEKFGIPCNKGSKTFFQLLSCDVSKSRRVETLN